MFIHEILTVLLKLSWKFHFENFTIEIFHPYYSLMLLLCYAFIGIHHLCPSLSNYCQIKSEFICKKLSIGFSDLLGRNWSHFGNILCPIDHYFKLISV